MVKYFDDRANRFVDRFDVEYERRPPKTSPGLLAYIISNWVADLPINLHVGDYVCDV